jgi:hypothetical protein
MRTEALFDAGERERWTGGRALVPLPADVCPIDGEPLTDVTTEEPVLFRHGGYGATRTSVTAWCSACGWSVLRSVTELRPA